MGEFATGEFDGGIFRGGVFSGGVLLVSADVPQNRCSQKFRNIHREALLLESLLNKEQITGPNKALLKKYVLKTKFFSNFLELISYFIRTVCQ